MFLDNEPAAAAAHASRQRTSLTREVALVPSHPPDRRLGPLGSSRGIAAPVGDTRSVVQLAPARTRDVSPAPPEQACVASLLLPVAGPSGAPPPSADLLRRGMLRVVREQVPDRRAGAALAELLHRPATPNGRPWTISPPIRRPEGTYFRLTLLGLSTSIEVAAAVREGAMMVPDHFRLGPRDRWGVRIDDLDALTASRGHGALERATITFLTAMTMRDTEGRGHDPTPDPVRLLRSWSTRWLGHLGRTRHPLAEPFEDLERRAHLQDWVREHATLEEHSLERHDVAPPTGRGALGGSPIPTVRGTMHLCIASPPCAERDAFRALLRFASHAGTGRHLAAGWGQTLVRVAAPPGPAPPPLDALFAAHEFG